MMKKRVLRGLALGLCLVMMFTASGLAEILRPNAEGEAVARLQQALTQLGYYTGTVDGKYGTGTENAVRAFQSAFGLKVDGKAGSATQYQLKLLTGIVVSDIAVPGESTGTTGGDSGADVEVAGNGLFSGNYRKMEFGASGSRVRVLQQALMALGFDINKADGVFGTSTYKAVKAFQQAMDLEVDGKAGPNTLKKLEAFFDSNGNCITGPLVTTPTQPDGGDEDLAYGVPQRVLRPGMSGLDVLYTQDRLKTLGYYKGTCDGQYGSGTTAAVEAFQKDNNLTVDGRVGMYTSSVLFSDSALANGQKPTVEVGTRVLRDGMEGADVLAVQKRLAALGYYTRTLDGKYGSGTVAAVKAFQERNGLKADGVCGIDTMRILNSDNAIDAGSSVTAPPDATIPGVMPTRILRPGYTGEDVKSVQYQLSLLDYYNGPIDGVYGDATVEAVKYFQARNGLTVDGKVGSKTVEKLYGDVAIPAEPNVNTPTPTPMATPGRTLRIGAKGDDVVMLQSRLIDLGYLTGKADGVFGAKTGAALTAFQLRNGLSADGVAGTKTYKKLFSADALPAANGTITTPPESAIPTRTLYEGCTGDDVRATQQRLKDLGYLAAAPDGKFGAATTAAMKAFQTRNSLNITGIGDATTLDLLFSGNALTADNEGGNAPEAENYTTLRLGASGNAVIRLQQMLSSLKYNVLVSGYYDETTRAAVLAFQQRNGLEADGVAGVLTQTKLYSGNCVTGDTNLPNDGAVIGGNGGGPSSTSQVKLLHWYNDIKGKLLTGKPTVLIYEPSSNSSYYVKVYSMGQHADAEPVTATDTATMKAAWGDKFSWDEKPVYVRLPNGTWCIASTHSMPHENNWIANNDCEGHICIHFPRTMSECKINAPENGVRHQNDIRKHWKALTGEDIPW